MPWDGTLRMFKNIFLLGCTCLVIAAMFEIFLFVAPQFQTSEPIAATVFCEGQAPEQRPSDRFGRTGVPNAVYFRRESEADGWNLRAYNRDGFRDLLDTGDENVLILGDSFIEGELVNNDRTIPHLLDIWNPDVAFREYALGGWGTVDQHRAYQVVGGEIDHELVVLGYYIGNDLTDNLRGSSGEVLQERPGEDDGSFLFDLHVKLRAFSRAYTFFYVNGRRVMLELLGKQSLEDRYMSPSDVEEGIQLTEERLSALGDAALENGAELLIVTLPSWNELIGIEGERQLAQQQRDLIQRTEEAKSNIHVLDLKNMVEAAGYEQLYGRIDKHFNELGYYLAAKAIQEWINETWRPSEATIPVMAGPGSETMRPDCSALPDHLKRFSTANPKVSSRSSRHGHSPGQMSFASATGR